ncbi:T9SS type A sorting domain-containing protein [Aridibaculum aurantiacum]|uniref:T9SS type A sorting domain-containing protein n=1 Tax=Aridibaculum aurantiacum TaxID=2810307 RepID=UPI001A971DD0|nr:T9SS type A sorting domain-containing protein [Aridibaculum aurantiacum]
MKTKLLLALATGLSIASVAQVTKINSNKSLSRAYEISNTKTILVSGIDSTLWITDATSAGTTQLSAGIMYKGDGILYNGKLIFRAHTAASGTELFISDGTANGTKLLKDINGGTASSTPADFIIFNNAVYFSAITPNEGRELWKTDGTESGTSLVLDVMPGTTGSNNADSYSMFSNGSYLLFSARTPAAGFELFKSNGTAAGTAMLKDINPGSPSSNTTSFFKYNNIVLFQASTATHGTEVWKTDGTEAGTVLLRNIHPTGSAKSMLMDFIFFELNGKALFAANDGVHGEELWSTDGTEANTAMIKDIQTGPNGSFSFLFNSIKIGNKMFFPVSNLFGTRYQIWETDGTTAGTALFKDFTFDEGTYPLILSAYEFTGETYTQPLFQGNKFFFIAKTETEGTELWVSDGTQGGTSMLKDILPGEEGGLEGSNLLFVYTSEGLYFTADDGVNGTEVWKSDGTSAGTVRVTNINTAGDSYPEGYWILNGKIVFEATDGDDPEADLYVLNTSVSPLPILLSDFAVTSDRKDALLQWSTSSEQNSIAFNVQRSFNGINYESIGTVAAAGNSSAVRNYSFVDKDIAAAGKEVVYYRLQLVDADGSNTYSTTRSVRFGNKSTLEVKLLGNPVQSVAAISFRGATSSLTVSVKDFSGRTLATTSAAASAEHITIPVSNLGAGIYTLVIETTTERKVLPFVKR